MKNHQAAMRRLLQHAVVCLRAKGTAWMQAVAFAKDNSKAAQKQNLHSHVESTGSSMPHLGILPISEYSESEFLVVVSQRLTQPGTTSVSRASTDAWGLPSPNP